MIRIVKRLKADWKTWHKTNKKNYFQNGKNTNNGQTNEHAEYTQEINKKAMLCYKETARCRMLSTSPRFHLEFCDDPTGVDQCLIANW